MGPNASRGRTISRSLQDECNFLHEKVTLRQAIFLDTTRGMWQKCTRTGEARRAHHTSQAMTTCDTHQLGGTSVRVDVAWRG